MSTLNGVESNEEMDKPEDQEISQIVSLREALVEVKSICKYISSIKIQNCISLFFSTVELENALTYEMTSRQSLKQANIIDFFHKC